jgi:hypothetical protein
MTPSASPAAPRRRLAAALFALILGAQLIVPVVQFPKERPTHFGWHMFCDWRPLPKYWIVHDDGSTREVDLQQHVEVRRLDADYHAVLPEFLRQTHPEAVAVRWQWPDHDEMEEWRWAP